VIFKVFVCKNFVAIIVISNVVISLKYNSYSNFFECASLVFFPPFLNLRAQESTFLLPISLPLALTLFKVETCFLNNKN